MPNCDWGRPCDCSDCRPSPGQRQCIVCGVKPGTIVIKKDGMDRKGMSYIIFDTYCEQCHKPQKSTPQAPGT